MQIGTKTIAAPCANESSFFIPSMVKKAETNAIDPEPATNNELTPSQLLKNLIDLILEITLIFVFYIIKMQCISSYFC